MWFKERPQRNAPGIRQAVGVPEPSLLRCPYPTPFLQLPVVTTGSTAYLPARF
jgi:hypothetical protein